MIKYGDNFFLNNLKIKIKQKCDRIKQKMIQWKAEM